MKYTFVFCKGYAIIIQRSKELYAEYAFLKEEIKHEETKKGKDKEII